MAIKKLGTYKNPNVQPITEDLDWWKKAEGSPTMRTWIEHTTDDEKFMTGFWEATPGSYRVKYDVDEFIFVFEGKFTLIPDEGEPQTFSAGDALLIEAGFDGIWKTEETVRKVLAIRAK